MTPHAEAAPKPRCPYCPAGQKTTTTISWGCTLTPGDFCPKTRTQHDDHRNQHYGCSEGHSWDVRTPPATCAACGYPSSRTGVTP